ncbi:MAG: winged helix-turn-helix domain-containing protein [Nitrospira sp.]|nr:winged helix-turn-helix domain-containing protein [Nitrospira sp.]
MDLQGQRDLLLLTELERGEAVTQRSLATKLGVALGLANLYLKRLVRKGYVKVTTIPPHRIRYLLTPQGVAEKSRLTSEYVKYSLSYYRDMRRRLKTALETPVRSGAKRLAVYGTGELAELAYLTLRELGLAFVGFVDDRAAGTFLSYPIRPIASLKEGEFDGLLIADLECGPQIMVRLVRHGIPKEKIFSIGFTDRVSASCDVKHAEETQERQRQDRIDL